MVRQPLCCKTALVELCNSSNVMEQRATEIPSTVTIGRPDVLVGPKAGAWVYPIACLLSMECATSLRVSSVLLAV